MLIGAQAIVNQETGEQLRYHVTTMQGTLKAAQRTMRIYGDSTRGPTAELTQHDGVIPPAQRPARQHAGQSRAGAYARLARTRSPATWPR